MTVTRCEATIENADGFLDACDRPAVSIRFDAEVDEYAWPACEAHASARYVGDGQWASS